MKKYILPALFAMFVLTFPNNLSAASNLEVSNTADFSSQSLNFGGGETIFVRIQSLSAGSRKSQLNLRDIEYNLVNTTVLFFELCATFNKPSQNNTTKMLYPIGAGISQNWDHAAGRVCFQRTIDKQLYPPLVK